VRGCLLIAHCSGWIFWLVTTNAPADDSETALRRRFLEAVPQTAHKLQQMSFSVRGHCIVTHDYATISDAMREKYKQHKDFGKPVVNRFDCGVCGPFGWESTSSRSIVTVLAKNDEYAFRLSRGDKQQSYTLSFLERLGATATADELIRKSDAESRAVLLGSWYLFGHPLEYFVESRFFRLNRVSAIQNEGLVRIEFDHLVDDPKRERERLADAFAICDPAHDWALREYGATLSKGSAYRVAMEWGREIDGFPLPQRVNILLPMASDPATISRTVWELDVSDMPMAEEEFYLTHYGLPEPTFQQAWLGPWVWYLLAGLACLGVAAVIVRRRRMAG
jgi:hypothetical protein